MTLRNLVVEPSGYGFHPTPFGECLLAMTPRGICGLAFVTEEGREAALADLRQRWAMADLVQYDGGTRAVAKRTFAAKESTEPGTQATVCRTNGAKREPR